jgi:hypothetical protein
LASSPDSFDSVQWAVTYNVDGRAGLSDEEIDFAFTHGALMATAARWRAIRRCNIGMLNNLTTPGNDSDIHRLPSTY